MIGALPTNLGNSFGIICENITSKGMHLPEELASRGASPAAKWTFAFSGNAENSHRTGKSVCARTNRPKHRKMQKGVEPGKPGNESSLSSHGASDNAKGTGFQRAVSLGLRCESARHSTDRNRIGHQTQGRLDMSTRRHGRLLGSLHHILAWATMSLVGWATV